jgi:hypothetical protein
VAFSGITLTKKFRLTRERGTDGLHGGYISLASSFFSFNKGYYEIPRS